MKSFACCLFVLCLLGLAVGVPVLAEETPPPAKPEQKPLTVLFVGNSFTLANYPSIMLQLLSEAAKVDRKIKTDMYTEGSTSFQDHWEKTEARKAIASHAWDYVVLQERSFYPIEQPDLMMKYGALLDGDVKKIKAKTIFFETWADKDNQDQQKAIHETNMVLGMMCGAYVAPAGDAEHYVLKKKPDYPFYEKDGHHESQQGAYLIACVFFSVIYKQSPLGLPGKLSVKDKNGKEYVLVDLPDDEAAFLQKAAWDTVDHFKSYEPVTKDAGNK